MPKPALIIFDIDGTLLRADLITVPALEQTFCDFGIEPPPRDRIHATFGMPVAEYEAWLATLAPGRGPELVDAANRKELEFIRETGELYHGTVETLTRLTAQGHVLATCSNGSVPYVDTALEAHGLRPFFEHVRCIGQGFSGKPAMVRDIMDASSVRPVLVVGDRRGDIDGAHANGALAVAARYGFGSEAELTDADAFIDAFPELPALVPELVSPRA